MSRQVSINHNKTINIIWVERSSGHIILSNKLNKLYDISVCKIIFTSLVLGKPYLTSVMQKLKTKTICFFSEAYFVSEKWCCFWYHITWYINANSYDAKKKRSSKDSTVQGKQPHNILCFVFLLNCYECFGDHICIPT